jgi:O-antigen ligase
VGVAFLVPIFGRRETNFRIPTAVALVGLFSVCLYLGNTRTAWFGLALTVLLGYCIASRRRPPFLRLAGGLAIALVVLFVIARFGGTLQEYLYRGEPQQTIQSLNGRIPLWQVGLQHMDTPMRWIGGYGAGSTRVVFASELAWAGDAHSAWLELLLSLGLLGVAAGAVLVILVGARLFGGPLESPLLPILFIYIVAVSPVGSNFGTPGPGPGLGYGLLALCYAGTAARDRLPHRSAAGARPHLEHQLRPASI